MPRFDSATFGAPEGGPNRGLPRPSYQGLCGPRRLLAVRSSILASRERRRLLEADAGHERVGMPMRQPPFGPFAAIDQGDAQRPVLGRQAADPDVGPFDNG